MIKKLVTLTAFVSFVLSGCSFLTFPVTRTPTATTTTLSTTMTSTTMTSTTSLSTLSTTSAPVTTLTSSTTTTDPTTSTLVTENESFVLEEYENIQDALIAVDEVVSIPSIGSPKALVLAIDFSDYPSSGSTMTLADLELAFNGQAGQTGYQSVNSYFQISSGFDGMGNGLDLTADIYGFYRAQYSSSAYASDYETGSPASDLVVEVLGYYDSVIDYTQYDANDDGYIDALYILYTAPVSFDFGSDLWWAYMDLCVYYDQFDGTEPYYFVFAGTDFFRDSNEEIDARTVIHETGHLLGLDDYYDYDESDANNNSGGLGGADMMDNTIGDMNPFSKMLLGWITPTVVTGTGTFILPEYVQNGDVLLLIDEWNGTIFDEYLLITYYTPEGLYEEDAYDIFFISGVILYHVDARIGDGFDENLAYWSIFNYNNTDTEHKLIKIIEADENGNIDAYSMAENTDLFQTGDQFDESYEADFFWYQEGLGPMDFEIAIGDLTSNGLTIEIIRN